jgi:hypothetical protein
MRVYLLLAAITVGFFAGWYVNGLRLNAEIDSLHATWNEAYANQAKITVTKEHELNQLNTQVEVDNANQAKAIDDAHVANLKLAADVERLQHTASSSGSPMPKARTSCKCANSAPQSGLSAEGIDLLVTLARDADDAARYANTCREWAVGVTKELDEPH